MSTVSRRGLLKRGGAVGGGLAAAGPLGAFSAATAAGQEPEQAAGYGPLVPKGDLAPPAAFNHQRVSVQGTPMDDGRPTPGVFDGMGAFPQNRDNVVIVPRTGDIFVQEDGGGDQFVRGVTQEGAVYDFARAITSDSELCAGCFSPDGSTLFLDQEGGRGSLPSGPPDDRATTYAIYGPFERRAGSNAKTLGNGPSR